MDGEGTKGGHEGREAKQNGRYRLVPVRRPRASVFFVFVFAPSWFFLAERIRYVSPTSNPLGVGR